jgi:hypothetical protein
LGRGKLLPLSKTKGYTYPPKPEGLLPLDPVSGRLISARLPFMYIHRLGHEGSYGTVGPIIGVPVDVSDMAKQLPRRLKDECAFNVNTKRNAMHKSV